MRAWQLRIPLALRPQNSRPSAGAAHCRDQPTAGMRTMSRSTSSGSRRMTRGPLRYAVNSPAAILRRRVRLLRPIRSVARDSDSN